MMAPLLNGTPGVMQVSKPVLIEAGIAKSSVETFHECILGRFPRLNKVEFDATTLCPEEHRFTGQLRTVDTNQCLGS